MQGFMSFICILSNMERLPIGEITQVGNGANSAVFLLHFIVDRGKVLLPSIHVTVIWGNQSKENGLTYW